MIYVQNTLILNPALSTMNCMNLKKLSQESMCRARHIYSDDLSPLCLESVYDTLAFAEVM
jgi:hypothetical protein